MSIFYSRLNYTLGNEDWQTELKALQITPQNHVLCISASGDRPLHLVLHNCEKVVAVDANPLQNYLLELKIKAMQVLNAEEYRAFLGATPCISRKATLRKLSSHLSSEARHYWLKNDNLIHNGIIYQGKAEKWVRKFSALLRMTRSKEIRQLLSVETLEEQQHFMKHHWNHGFWKNSFKCILHPWILKYFLKDPGLYAYVDTSLSPAAYLYERLVNCLNNSLAKENPLLSLVLFGKVLPEGLPPYLTAKGIRTIKERLRHIIPVHSDIVSYLESVPENSFDRFSLSDVASYLNQEQFLRLLKAMYRSAKPGARFCMRQFMTRYKIPEGLKPYFAREPQLEKQLEKEDRAFVYDFTIGKILKD